jgi:hypothetical protein
MNDACGAGCLAMWINRENGRRGDERARHRE